MQHAVEGFLGNQRWRAACSSLVWDIYNNPRLSISDAHRNRLPKAFSSFALSFLSLPTSAGEKALALLLAFFFIHTFSLDELTQSYNIWTLEISKVTLSDKIYP